MKQTEFKPGDIVRYRSRFLRSICDYTQSTSSKHAVVINQHPDFIDSVVIVWCDGITMLINKNNIEKSNKKFYWPPSLRHKISATSSEAYKAFLCNINYS